jgi:hypothetical protein
MNVNAKRKRLPITHPRFIVEGSLGFEPQTRGDVPRKPPFFLSDMEVWLGNSNWEEWCSGESLDNCIINHFIF